MRHSFLDPEEETMTPEALGLIQTRYVRYSVANLLGLYFDGADARLTPRFWTAYANSLADLVVRPEFTSTNHLAPTIGGDVSGNEERCGIPGQDDPGDDHSAVERWQFRSLALLEGWDTTGHLAAWGVEARSRAGAQYVNDYINYSTARLLTGLLHPDYFTT